MSEQVRSPGADGPQPPVSPVASMPDAAGDPDSGIPAPGTPADGVADTVGARVRRRLDTLADLDLAQHPDVFAALHSDLATALAGIDDA